MKLALATLHRKPQFVPLALWCLESHLVGSTLLKRNQIDVLEFTTEWRARDVLRSVLASKPDILGFSCYVWNVAKTLRVCRLLKMVRPSVLIVLGGPEVGPRGKELLDACQFIDAVVDGEGEFAMAEIVERFLNGADLAGVPGVAVRQGTTVIVGRPRPVVSDLSTFFSPYLGFDRDLTGKLACLETQRGCVFSCNFCFYSKGNVPGSRSFALDRVRSEIDVIMAGAPAGIYLMDPVFNLNMKRAKEICSYIAGKKGPHIEIQTEIWAEFVDEELAQLMAEAGFDFVEVGLQSFNVEVLKAADRRARLDRLAHGVELLNRAGLRVELQLILGLPGDTRATFLASLEQTLTLQSRYIAVFPLLLLPGTELRHKAETLGLVFDPEPPYTVIATNQLAPDEIFELEDLAYAVDRVSRFGSIAEVRRGLGLDYLQVAERWIAIVKAEKGATAKLIDEANLSSLMRAVIEMAGDQPGLEFYKPMLNRELGGGRSVTS